MSTTVDSASASVTQEIINYCNSVGIDYEQYISDLDGTSSSIDIDNELLMAYYQYAFVQMYQLIYGEELYAGEGSVGEPDYDTLISSMSSDDIAVINQIIQDDPELMAFFAYQAGGQSESDALMALLAELSASAESSSGGSSSGETGYVGLAYDVEEMGNAAENAILQSISDMQTAIVNIYSEMQGLDPDAANYESQLAAAQSQADMQTAGLNMQYAMLQQATQTKSSMLDLISAMLDKQLESQQALVNNLKVSA